MFHKYPYTDFHELNLDWILHEVKKLSLTVSEFTAFNEIKFADPITWDQSIFYPKMTIVVDPNTGDSYISKSDVPAGVALNDPNYWQKIASFDASLLEFIRMFENVNDMTAYDLVPGTLAFTKGYYADNDGGACLYEIDTTDAQNSIPLANGNYAIPVKTGRFFDPHKMGDDLNGNLPYIESLQKFEKMYEGMLWGGMGDCYGEGLTYDSKRKQFVACGWDFTNSVTNLSTILPDGTVSGPVTINTAGNAPYAISYNADKDLLYVTTYYDVYEIDPSTLTISGTLTIPAAVSSYVMDYDNSSDRFVFYTLDGTDVFLKIYDKNMSLISSYSYSCSDTPRNGIAAYDGKVWIATQTALLEIDLESGTLLRHVPSSLNEIEDICYHDGILYMFAHVYAVNGIDAIYKYADVSENGASSYDVNMYTAAQWSARDLNTCRGLGHYYVTDGSGSLNFPSGETEGLVIVTGLKLTPTASSPMNRINQLFISEADPTRIYMRGLFWPTNAWTSWTTLQLGSYDSASGWIWTKYDNGLVIASYKGSSSFAMTTARGSCYMTSSAQTVNYPFTIYDATASVSLGNNGSAAYNCWAANVNPFQTNVGFTPACNSSTTLSQNISIIVVGRWKP